MNAAARNRLLGLGVLWGLCLSPLLALVMADPLRPSGFLVAAVLCALLSGAVGTMAAGRRAASRIKKGRRNPVLAGLDTALFQGLVGGGIAALIFWGIVAFTISGVSFGSAADLSSLMRPRVFLGSFFVSLSVFVYILAGRLLLGPIFGTLVNRVAGIDAEGESR